MDSQTRSQRVTLVVPCYNEARRLDVRAFVDFVHEHDVGFLFVDDGSADETRELLVWLVSQDPTHFQLLGLDRNGGKAEAVRQGVLHLADAQGGFVGYWDADLATPLNEVGNLLAAFRRHPDAILAMGTRVRLLGSAIERSWVRHYCGRVFATLASLAIGVAVYDTQCGAKVLKLNATTLQAFRTPFRGRWSFDVEMIMRLIALQRAGGRHEGSDIGIVEVPLARWADVGGSKLRLSDGVAAVWDLAVLWWRRMRATPRSHQLAG